MKSLIKSIVLICFLAVAPVVYAQGDPGTGEEGGGDVETPADPYIILLFTAGILWAGYKLRQNELNKKAA